MIDHSPNQENNSIPINVSLLFSCPVYIIERAEFLSRVKKVSEEALKVQRKSTKLDEIYPVIMSNNYYNDSKIYDFTNFISSTSWNILRDQGYNMDDKETFFLEMWTQEHHKNSLMEQHVHSYGSQICGFYFLEVPKNSSKIIFYDPRAGKIQGELPEKDYNQATLASRTINFEPKPGMLFLTNSWLAHSFTKHASSKPLKFVHVNLSVRKTGHDPLYTSYPNTAAEIV